MALEPTKTWRWRNRPDQAHSPRRKVKPHKELIHKIIRTTSTYVSIDQGAFLNYLSWLAKAPVDQSTTEPETAFRGTDLCRKITKLALPKHIKPVIIDGDSRAGARQKLETAVKKGLENLKKHVKEGDGAIRVGGALGPGVIFSKSELRSLLERPWPPTSEPKPETVHYHFKFEYRGISILEAAEDWPEPYFVPSFGYFPPVGGYIVLGQIGPVFHHPGVQEMTDAEWSPMGGSNESGEPQAPCDVYPARFLDVEQTVTLPLGITYKYTVPVAQSTPLDECDPIKTDLAPYWATGTVWDCDDDNSREVVDKTFRELMGLIGSGVGVAVPEIATVIVLFCLVLDAASWVNGGDDPDDYVGKFLFYFSAEDIEQIARDGSKSYTYDVARYTEEELKEIRKVIPSWPNNRWRLHFRAYAKESE